MKNRSMLFDYQNAQTKLSVKAKIKANAPKWLMVALFLAGWCGLSIWFLYALSA